MPCDVIRRYLTAFHKMFKIKSGIVPHMLVHLQAKFGSVWATFYLFMTSNVHPFFTTIFFIPCCIWSPIFKLLLFLSHSSVLYKWPLVRKLCCSLWVFMFYMFASGNVFICEPNIYAYIICLLIDKFMPLLFIHSS